MATALQTITGNEIATPAPQRPSLPRAVASALADTSIAAWTPEMAMMMITKAGYAQNLPQIAVQFSASLAPVDRRWLADRLSLMWTQMAHAKDADIATGWLHETSRLLADLPHDIAEDAIDEAIKDSARGFMPSVGEIRKFADPMLRRRKSAAARLNYLVGIRGGEERRTDEPKKICTPEQAAAALEEFGQSSVFKGKRDVAVPEPDTTASAWDEMGDDA